ncbi:phage tail tape measure protein [Methylobacterium organophilum]|uniref:phage tail tape measure protein n=1 Tax=Methylobacterium organophilum TaxID=410 RepID=UPI001F147BFE|nr:phage tail tape measure protein [Methylobacterium organophilum]UMY18558.1 phage tail tape measure protein [Methylobacterium organophilum]
MAEDDATRSDAERVKSLESLDRLARSFGRSLTQALTSSLSAGRQLDSVLDTLSTRLAGLALRAAAVPVRRSVANLVTQVLGRFSGADEALARGGVIENGRVSAYAKGAAFPGGIASGRVQPFAAGGIVAAPTYFPLANGTGLMGEAGPEAVMPLRRGSDGRLGVAASGGERPVAVTVNITTPDAESFRRSEAQVAATLARAVARGRRAL